MWNKVALVVVVLFGLSACGYVDRYEEHVHDWDPVYCYKSLASTTCYESPNHRDEARLVNYFGPHPSRYDAPVAPETKPLQAPEMVNYYVKDPEPIPRAKPSGDTSDRPWLTEEGRAAATNRTEVIALQSSETGTRAFLRMIDDGGNRAELDLPSPDLSVQ